jgi:predicted CXXCH cytochrome family protein
MNQRFVANTLMYMVAALLLLAVQPGIAGTITGSQHDFTASSWSGGRICVACHTPHKADVSISDAPLWNHKSTTQTYTLYNTTTTQAVIGQPGSTSKLCLSCHDGTVAVDSFGGATGTTNISAVNNIGTTLADDHPIGFAYNSTLVTADGSLADPTVKQVTIGTGTQSKTGTIAALMLYSGKVECSSCHDVHNTFTVGSTGMTKMAQAGSAICFACHIK